MKTCSWCNKTFTKRTIYPKGHTHYCRWGFCSWFCIVSFGL